MVRIFDYESKDCGFESHRDLTLLLLLSIPFASYVVANEAKAANQWVCSTVGSRRLLRMREVTGSSPVESTFCSASSFAVADERNALLFSFLSSSGYLSSEFRISPNNS